MTDALFFLLLVLPLVAAGVTTVLIHYSLWMLLMIVPLLLLSAIVLGILLVLSGTAWLQLLAPQTFESQGGGIGYLTFWVPFFAYSGGVAGACLVASLVGMPGIYPSLAVFQGIAILGTVVLGGVVPVAIVTLLWVVRIRNLGHLTGLAIVAIANALISAGLGSQLAHWIGIK